jgi:hypothetical protein
MTRATGTLSLRAFLVVVGFAGLAYVALVGAHVIGVLRPAASELRGQTSDLLTDHDAIERRLRRMRDARREVARHVPPILRDPAAPPLRTLEELRSEVRSLLDEGASMRASVERADLPLEMRLLLAEAVEQESAVGVSLIEATRAVALSRPSDAVEALRASGIRSDSTSVLLSAAQRVALGDLLGGEEALLQRLDGLGNWAAWWIVAGGLLFVVGALILRARPRAGRRSSRSGCPTRAAPRPHPMAD